jgi:hypothetical protein
LIKQVSGNGHLWHDGHHDHLGEIFAHCRVALHTDRDGRTELHFANVHLGYLVYDPEREKGVRFYFLTLSHSAAPRSHLR